MSEPPRIEAFRGLRAPDLVFALDYDGTLVTIVNRPEDARPDEALLRLLADLAEGPGHHVAVLSGRPLTTLEAWIGLPDVALIGTHGAEWRRPHGAPEPLLAPTEARPAAAAAADALESALAGIPGSEVERKPFGVAAHYRRVEERDRPGWRRAFEGARERADPRFTVHEGKCVLELRWPGVEKGRALVEVRRRLSWREHPVIALGDDRTDESTFATLGPDDLAVHVGGGSTLAPYSVPDAAAARAARERLDAAQAGLR